MLTEPLFPIVVLAAVALVGLVALAAYAVGYDHGHLRRHRTDAAEHAALKSKIQQITRNYALPPVRGA